MCGIVGYVAAPAMAGEFQRVLPEACDSLIHRGPDDSGMWMDASWGVGLGHRRLSIIDLSLAGHQPMISHTGRYVISYNGEVYNHQSLRKLLESDGYSFRGSSDTEVLLAGFETWGLSETITRSIGMFAFALWDSREHFLYLVRDRLGVKPLYYGKIGSGWVFASELKALKRFPGFQSNIHADALAALLRLGYIPAPHSIFHDIFKLLPGTILSIQAGNLEHRNSPIPYWSVHKIAEEGNKLNFEGDDEEALNQLDNLLRDAVRLRMISDVPLGAFLSGGIDSSLIVALMQAQSDIPIKTFTIGFSEKEFDEAVHARNVARHLRTDHTELFVTPKQVIEIIPRLAHIYDEPFADSSQIPTFLVSELTRQYVTVSLSGDGGDELFWGYIRYPYSKMVWDCSKYIPVTGKAFLSRGMSLISLSPAREIANFTGRFLFHFGQREPLSDKILKLGDILSSRDQDSFYLRVISHWQRPNEIVTMAKDTSFTLPKIDFLSFEQKMMLYDQYMYLPDDILVKVDRASMHVSLEARQPFLDHRVVEFAWRLPFKMKYRNGDQKWLLKQLLYHYVPRNMVDRPKTGFGIPIGEWLRGPLREWAEDLINSDRFGSESFISPEPVHSLWHKHLSRQLDASSQLWNVLMFQAWLQEQ